MPGEIRWATSIVGVVNKGAVLSELQMVAISSVVSHLQCCSDDLPLLF